jgi:Gram-negative bacterial TonB protein C-terminal
VPPPDRSRRPGAEASGDPNSLALPAPSLAVAPGNINVAVVGLNPVDGVVRPPEGSRPAQFSTAPTVGKPATGDVETSPGSIPGLSIQGAKTGAALSANNNIPATPSIAERHAKMVVYQQLDGGVELRTLSTPLRPSSRSIPRALETRFQGRSVYTLVIPVPNMPDYTGDWIMWFAETQTATGGSPLIRAPVPYRKLQPIENTQADRTEARVQVAVFIDASGHLRPFAPLQHANALTEAALDDILRWEFRPATYNGNPIEVEAVIEVPIRIAQRARAKLPAQ